MFLIWISIWLAILQVIELTLGSFEIFGILNEAIVAIVRVVLSCRGTVKRGPCLERSAIDRFSGRQEDGRKTLRGCICRETRNMMALRCDNGLINLECWQGYAFVQRMYSSSKYDEPNVTVDECGGIEQVELGAAKRGMRPCAWRARSVTDAFD